jgi:hypothetical protein
VDTAKRSFYPRNGLGNRPRDGWRSILARGEVETCTATSKRSGKRCRMPPTNGCGGVCYFHGARGGRGNFRWPTSMRHLRNKEIQRARMMAQAEVDIRLAARDLHPEVHEAIKTYIGRIHPADEARMLLMLDHLFKGDLTNEAWFEFRQNLGLTPMRPSKPKPPAPPEKPEEPLFEVLFGDDPLRTSR